MTATLERVSATYWPPRSDSADGFTVADLHALPDDGPRYELIDGSLIVSPSATGSHNLIARWIAHELEACSPTREWVVGFDQSASIDDRNELRPDIVVFRSRYMTQTPLPITSATLAAEVVSPHSRRRDKQTKRDLYAEAGVAAYWIVEPDEDKGVISLAELRLDGKAYREATPSTSEVFHTTHPWPVRIDLRAISRRWQEYLDYAD
jgi:Uma2 family endonuclease